MTLTPTHRTRPAPACIRRQPGADGPGTARARTTGRV